MNKSLFSIGLIFSLFFVFTACAQQSETRSLSDFNGISTSEGIEVVARKGSKNEAKITAKGIDLDDVISEVRSGELRFELQGNNHRNVTVEVELTYTEELSELAASSGSTLEMKDDINADDLEVDASSAGRVEFHGKVKSSDLEIQATSAGKIEFGTVNAKQIDAKASSAGRIELSGTADEIELHVSSSGTIDGEELKAQDVDAEASSGGGVKIHVEGRLSASASSGGWIKYKGSPSNKNINKSSGGSVRSM